MLPFDPEPPAHGGRSDRFIGAGCGELLPTPAAVLAGRLVLLPKPCGARPRSVALPWAAQFRVLLAPLVAPGLFVAPAAEGGRFCESWLWRLVIGVVFDGVEPGPDGVTRFDTLLFGRFCESCGFWRVAIGAVFGALFGCAERLPA
jgi:hypothetical protein